MTVVLWVIGVGIPALIVVAFVRGRRVSSGMAGALAEVSEMLDPGKPRAEVLASLRDGERDEDDDDDGEPKSPTCRRGCAPRRGAPQGRDSVWPFPRAPTPDRAVH